MVRGQYRAGAGGARSVAREFFRRGLRALGRPHRHLAAANRAGPDAADAVRRRAAQYPVSKPGAGALLYYRPVAAIHCRRDGRARQRTIPGGDCGAALRRANRAGDAVGRRGIARICRATRRRSRTALSRFRRTRTCWQTIARSCSNKASRRFRSGVRAATAKDGMVTPRWRRRSHFSRRARKSGRSHTFRRAGWGSGRSLRGGEIRLGRRRWRMRLGQGG